MMKPHWDRFEWDDQDKKNGNLQHLRDHCIEPEEAEECFFHEYSFGPDDRRSDRVYLMDGVTDRGRRLRLVFQDKGNGRVRVITGWDVKLTRKRKQ